MLKKHVILAFLVCLIGIHSSSDAFAKDKFWSVFSGTFYNHLRLRTTGGVSDSDYETRFTLNIGDELKNKVTGHLQAGAFFDLNGKQAGGLNSIYDSFGGNSTGRLYYAYADITKTLLFNNVRIGRQHNYDFETFYFDGLSFDTLPFYGFKLSAYAGKPVHFYENEFGWGSGDYLIGSALTWTPVQKLRVRFDLAHLRDNATGFRVTQGDQEDTLLGATAWLDILENWDFYSRFTSFSDQVRDLSFGSTVKFKKADLILKASVYRLLQPYDIRVPELDAYGIAGTYQRYTDVMLNVIKGLGKHVRANGGFSWRKLDAVQVASAFNQVYKRGFLTIDTSDVPIKGLSLSATADYYHGEDNVLRDNYFGGSFYASQSFLKKRLIATAGTAYYLYRFNYATANESANVQTVYAKVEAKVTKKIKVKTNYEYEHNSLNSFHTVNLGISWDF